MTVYIHTGARFRNLTSLINQIKFDKNLVHKLRNNTSREKGHINLMLSISDSAKHIPYPIPTSAAVELHLDELPLLPVLLTEAMKNPISEWINGNGRIKSITRWNIMH